jgi:hypothetical protein
MGRRLDLKKTRLEVASIVDAIYCEQFSNFPPRTDNCRMVHVAESATYVHAVTSSIVARGLQRSRRNSET